MKTYRSTDGKVCVDWRTVTEPEAYLIGMDHGQSAIMFYPPTRWGRDDHEDSQPAPANICQSYRRGYADGQARCYRKEAAR